MVIPLHPSPLLQNIEQFRSKSIELKKPRFCTGNNGGKGETMLRDGTKRMLKVLLVMALNRNKNKRVWNWKANKQEWDVGHKGCCSLH